MLDFMTLPMLAKRSTISDRFIQAKLGRCLIIPPMLVPWVVLVGIDLAAGMMELGKRPSHCLWLVQKRVVFVSTSPNGSPAGDEWFIHPTFLLSIQQQISLNPVSNPSVFRRHRRRKLKNYMEVGLSQQKVPYDTEYRNSEYFHLKRTLLPFL